MQIVGEPMLMICTSYDVFLCSEFLFGVTTISPSLKFLVELIFLSRLIPCLINIFVKCFNLTALFYVHVTKGPWLSLL